MTTVSHYGDAFDDVEPELGSADTVLVANLDFADEPTAPWGEVQCDGSSLDVLDSDAVDHARVHGMISDLVGEFAPHEVDYFELIGDDIVAALLAGEDVRTTFALTQTAGELGMSPHVVTQPITVLHIATAVYRVFTSLEGREDASSLRDELVSEYLQIGYHASAAIALTDATLDLR